MHKEQTMNSSMTGQRMLSSQTKVLNSGSKNDQQSKNYL